MSETLADLIPPLGARLHIVRISFKPDRGWDEAIDLAGHGTPDDSSVRKVGHQYPPTGNEETNEDIILLRLHNSDSFDVALAWARENKLENTVPREVFAIGEQYPKLYDIIGENPIHVVATEECNFNSDRRACYVWWRGSRCQADLGHVVALGRVCTWFAFRRPTPKA